MHKNQHVVIVGGGLAGGSAARTLRKEGHDGPITLVTAEDHLPYERPPLSKEYIRGESSRAQAYVQPGNWWADNDVDVLTGVSAAHLDLSQRKVALGDGSQLAFDRLLLAPGAEPRQLTVPGAELDGIVTLRTFDDADRIAEAAKGAGQVVIVGGGWIASEVSASLRTLGHAVTLVLPGSTALEHHLGRQVGGVYSDLHTEHGVTMRTGERIVQFEGRGGVAQRAQTSSGHWLEAGLVVVAIGVEPRVELAAEAGLLVDDGIVVDGQLRVWNTDVYAAGDVAVAPYPSLGRSARVDHWRTALAQGRHAARAMLGSPDAYDELPYFFSDQYETGMEFWGDPALPGELVVRGQFQNRSFDAFWHDQGRVTAVLNMHVHHHHDHGEHSHAGGHLDPATVKQLLRSPNPVNIDRLGDSHVPLEVLLNPVTDA